MLCLIIHFHNMSSTMSTYVAYFHPSEFSPKKRRGKKQVRKESVSDNDVDYAPDRDTDNEEDMGSIKAKFKKHSPRNRLSGSFRDDGDYKTFQKRIK